MNIVNTNKPYTYFTMKQNLSLLKTLFPFIDVSVIGKSVLGQDLYLVRLGNGSKSVFYSASIHANEWITSLLLMKFIEDYCDAFLTNSTIDDVSIAELFYSTSIYIMPMVNPDGVNLVNNMYDESSYPFIKAKSISSDFLDIPFPDGWKSNINGVDLKIYQPIREVL